MSNSEMRFSCPACGQHIECGAAWGGASLDCPACGKSMRVPDGSGPAEPPKPVPVRSFAAPGQSMLNRRPSRAQDELPSWVAGAATYSIYAPILGLTGLWINAALRTGLFVKVTAVIQLFLMFSGIVAGLIAVVCAFFYKQGLVKGVVGTCLSSTLVMLFVMPALHAAWITYREINLEKRYNLRQWHARALSYIPNKSASPQDRAKAVELLRVSAERGYRPSQYSLGVCYNDGIGAPTNRVQAYKWLRLAQRRGSKKAVPLVQSLEGEMSPSELAEARRLIDQFVARRDPPEPLEPSKP